MNHELKSDDFVARKKTNMPHLNGVAMDTLTGRTIKSVAFGAPHGLMPKINHYNAYTLVTELNGIVRTFVVWNGFGETNLSEVKG